MGKMYDWLDRRKRESARGYDNRINQYPPQHAGYIFFDRINYDAVRHVFSVFAVWNGELNEKLQDALPQGGFEIHCSRQEAEYFCSELCGVPVFIQLFAKAGRLYTKELYIRYCDKIFLVNFTGCEVVPLQLVCFRGLQEVPEPETQKDMDIYQGSGFPLRVLQDGKKAGNNQGSGKLRIGQGSFRIGRGSFPTGSFYVMRYQGSGFRLVGSFHIGSGKRMHMHEWEWEYAGSKVRGSFLRGSANRLSGSMRGSAGNLLDFTKTPCLGSAGALLPDANWATEYWMEIFGIGCLGYGLNLI